jgi:hypothetical protein
VSFLDGGGCADQFSLSTAARDTKRVHTTGNFPALHFNAVKKQFVATCKVTIPVDHDLGNRPFVVTDLEAQAVAQIRVSFSSAWLAPVQRL